MRRFYPPFVVLPLPLDTEGRGPVDDPVETIWEVWDAACQTVSSHKDEGLAVVAQAYVTEMYSTPNP